jgi:transposase
LLRSNFLPRVWTPDQSTRQLRSRSTERANLTADRTRQKNRIHSLLHQRLIHSPCDDLFSKRGRVWLNSLCSAISNNSTSSKPTSPPSISALPWIPIRTRK